MEKVVTVHPWFELSAKDRTVSVGASVGGHFTLITILKVYRG